MEAETNKRDLARAAFKYKPKLGLFSRTNMLREYLKVRGGGRGGVEVVVVVVVVERVP